MHERTIPLEGSVNLRDFGGYKTDQGGRVRRGRLFRSGSLAGLSRQARQAFRDLDIGLICDLRRIDEARAAPTPFPRHNPVRLEIPISPGSAEQMYRELRLGKFSVEQGIDFMVRINRELAGEHTEDYARMFQGLIGVGDQGFLVHCAAGKDRTGFGCALILRALGVPWETVLSDYLLTNEAIDIEGDIMPQVVAYLGSSELPSLESVEVIAGVRPEYLRAAFEAIEAEFDSVEQYLEQAIGLDASARETLRSRLVVSDEE